MGRDRCYRLFHVDAFTRTRFEGNSAGVLLDADGLSEGEMQAIAAELRHSETAFLFEPDADDHDVIVRFFTPMAEVPVCGHATIASHFVRAKSLGLSAGTVRQKCGAGVLRIDLETVDGCVRVRMHQRAPVFRRALSDSETGALLEGLGLERNALDPGCPVEIVDTGHAKVLAGVDRAATLNALTPDSERLSRLSREIGCNGFHIFTLRPETKGVLTECRMFAPAIGIDEDPVTGNGNGPLGAYLVRHSLASHDGSALRFDSLQGRAMGRPGVARVEVAIENGEAIAVSVAGDAIVVYEAELRL